MLHLAVDGGGSGCRAVVARDGRRLGQGRGGPANISLDPEGACRNILTAARAALEDAGGGRLDDLDAVLGLAGANVPDAAARLAALLPFRSARIVTDAETAALGALGRADGIVAAMGTGSVFVRRLGGGMRQFGGRGFLLGDQGSGAVLGRALLAEALRAAEGFAPMTPLLEAVLDELGGIDGVVGFGLRARPADFAAFAPRVAAGGDAAARAIFAAALAEVRHVVEVIRQGRDLPVVFLGGLGPAYAAALAGAWRIEPAKGSALDGALLLASGG